jgi:DNA-binding PadR family transcriptional regulator
MSSRDLSLFDYEVLALVGNGGAGAHDLLQMARRGRVFAWAGESQYYTAPKRLARLGYLRARKEPGRTRERTVYELTETGRSALAAWARTPVHFPTFRHEAFTRLLAADLVGAEVTAAAIGTLRDDIAEVLTALDAAEQGAHALPHREQYLLLGHQLARRLALVTLEWVNDVERQLGSRDCAEVRRPPL